MKTVFLIFPNQLFQILPKELTEADEVLLIEDSLFFGDKQYPLNFHKQKLYFHLKALLEYENYLKVKRVAVRRVAYEKTKIVTGVLKSLKDCQFVTYEPVDYILKKRLQNTELKITFLENPLFLNSTELNHELLPANEKPLQYNFYVKQRQRLKVLLDSEGAPLGGAWSFDAENRKKVPKDKVESLPKLKINLRDEALAARVTKEFPQACGSLSDVYYPTNHTQASKALKYFLKKRFADFGPYEDAIVKDESLIYHSLLSPLINTGLLTPEEVLKEVLAYATAHEVPLASTEGFVRQLIGWREYMRAMYEMRGTQMRTSNHWNHTRKLPKSFYSGTTGLVPVDDAIRRVNETGYCHHIERLMVLGNIMFLLEINPDDIYAWFMEMFIDAYDWVMVPNVYAMSQNSAGGIITTKPYFSGSNYVLKMSNYKRGEWCDIWDGLYWRFIAKHSKDLAKNPRWAMMVASYEKNQEKYSEKISQAEWYIKTLELQ